MNQPAHDIESTDARNDDNQRVRMSREYRWCLMIMTALSCWMLTISVQPTGLPAVLLMGLGLMLLYRARLIWAVAYMFLLGWTIYMNDPIIGTTVEPPSFLFALLTVIFVGVAARYSEAARYQRGYELPADMGIRPIEPIEFLKMIFSSRWFGAYAAVCTAMLLLVITPNSERALLKFGLKTGWGHWILLVTGLGAFWLVCREFIYRVQRWNAPPASLEVEARSLINTEFYREMAGVEKRRAKHVQMMEEE